MFFFHGKIVAMKKFSRGHLAVVFRTFSEDVHVFLSKSFDHMDSKQNFKLHCQFGRCVYLKSEYSSKIR